VLSIVLFLTATVCLTSEEPRFQT